MSSPPSQAAHRTVRTVLHRSCAERLGLAAVQKSRTSLPDLRQVVEPINRPPLPPGSPGRAATSGGPQPKANHQRASRTCVHLSPRFVCFVFRGPAVLFSPLLSGRSRREERPEANDRDGPPSSNRTNGCPHPAFRRSFNRIPSPPRPASKLPAWAPDTGRSVLEELRARHGAHGRFQHVATQPFSAKAVTPLAWFRLGLALILPSRCVCSPHRQLNSFVAHNLNAP